MKIGTKPLRFPWRAGANFYGKSPYGFTMLLESLDGSILQTVSASRGYMYNWYRYANYPLREKENEGNIYRGYLQIDHTQIPKALEILTKIIRIMLLEGRKICFKFLLSSISLSNVRRLKTIADSFDKGVIAQEAIGFYADEDPSSPVFTLYADSREEIIDILRMLSRDPAWRNIESKREHPHRRKGTSSFIDENGVEWRTLCYNENPGFSEDVLDRFGDDWRNHVQGSKTFK